ncbi:MAG TPA: hypothetical protein VG826_27165 [Pirellulales bacterium]|nr:hypothetical protein [Pirellulales bacterium]
MNDDLLHEQLAYYRARAAEYDQWFLRQGRYDRGEEHRIQWETRSLRLKVPCPQPTARNEAAHFADEVVLGAEKDDPRHEVDPENWTGQ